MQAYLLANFFFFFFFKKLFRFGRNFSKGEIWAKVIRFGQNQNLASPKVFDLLRLCSNVLYNKQ